MKNDDPLVDVMALIFAVVVLAVYNFSIWRWNCYIRRKNLEALCAHRGIAMKPSGKKLDLLPGEWERIKGPMERLKELVPEMIAWAIAAISFVIVGAIIYWFIPDYSPLAPILWLFGTIFVMAFIGGIVSGAAGQEPEHDPEFLREAPLLRPDAHPAITSSATPGLAFRCGGSAGSVTESVQPPDGCLTLRGKRSFRQ
jgi:hypothetical protein